MVLHELDYHLCVENPAWSSLARTADFILASTKRNGLSFTVDKVTAGRGACFPIAVLQQLRRPVHYGSLKPELKDLVDRMDPQGLRSLVCMFMLTSPLVEDMRRMWPAESWRTRWAVTFMQPSEWADELFIKATAMRLGKDIKVTSELHTAERPFQTFSGHKTDRNQELGKSK